MRFLVDENIQSEVVTFLSSVGNVKQVSRGASDRAIAALAKSEKRILVTHDKDFKNPLLYPPEIYAGIIIIQIHPPDSVVSINALSNLFSLYEEAVFAEKVVILTSDRFLIHPT